MRLIFIRKAAPVIPQSYSSILEALDGSLARLALEIQEQNAEEIEDIECIPSRFAPMLRLLDFSNERLTGKWTWTQVLSYRRCRIECLYHYFREMEIELDRCRVIRLRTMPIDILHREKLRQQILIGKMSLGVLLYLCSIQKGIDMVDSAISELLAMATINVGPQLVRARP